MPKTRKLSDLYVVGKEVEIDDGMGDPVKVWVQKLNPIDHEKALRLSNGSRAKILSIRNLPIDHEDKIEFFQEVYEACPEKEQQIEVIAAEYISKISAAREDEIASEEEWSKEDYLQGLRDAWFGSDEVEGLSVLYFKSSSERDGDDEEYNEAARVFDELQKFKDQLEKILENELRGFKKELNSYSDEKIQSMLIDRFIELRADMEWLKDYRSYEILFGIRDFKNHNQKYFSHKTEVDELSIEVFAILSQAYQALNVEVIEGKD